MAREEMKRAHARQHCLGSKLSSDDSVNATSVALPELLEVLRDGACDFNAADRDGTGDVALPSDINENMMLALDSILGIRQGRVRPNGEVARDRVGSVRARFNLETSPNPFYVSFTKTQIGEYGNIAPMTFLTRSTRAPATSCRTNRTSNASASRTAAAWRTPPTRRRGSSPRETKTTTKSSSS